MSGISEFRKILGADQKVSAAALRHTIAKATDFLAESAGKLDELERGRTQALLHANDAEIAKLDNALAASRLERERAETALRVLRERLVVVDEAESAAAIEAERAQIEQNAAAAAERLSVRYPVIVDDMRQLLAAVAEADLAAGDFARKHPDTPPIATVEQRVRMVPGGRRIVKEERVWAWRRADGTLFHEHNGHTVRPAPSESGTRRLRAFASYLQEVEAGRLSPTTNFRLNYGDGAPVTAVLAIARTVEVRRAYLPEALGCSVTLPPLSAGQRGYRPPSAPFSSASPDAVLRVLAAPLQESPQPEMRVELVEAQEDCSR